MPGSYCETWRLVCDGLGSNILVFCWSYNTLNGRITASDCVDILGNQGQMLSPNNNAIFKDDYSHIHTARSIQSWFQEHEDALQHLPWPA
jgi:hypothetical protein